MGVVSNALHNAFVVPVRRGRVKLEGLPRAVRGVVVAAYVSYGLLVVGVLASPLVSSFAPARDGMGLLVAGSPAVAFGMWASMVLLFLAALEQCLLAQGMKGTSGAGVAAAERAYVG